MGSILAVPSALNRAVQTVIERGVQYCALYCICYIYLTIREFIYRRRFDLYDYEDDDPEKTAFFVPHEEWKLDTPQADHDRLAEKADDAFCFGVNSSSEALTVRVARLPGSSVQCSLFLRLSDGRAFSLPQEHTFQRENSEDYTFGSSRLKLQCLIPMRKWRIFFNGILRELSEEDENHSKYQHVTFTFIATASSGIFDFSTDMSKTLLSHSFLESSMEKPHPIRFFQRLRDIFDCYEQSVMILGTYTVGKEDEKEMYLWGSRGRYMGERNVNGDIEEVCGNFQDGSTIHLGLMNIDKTHRKFAYGYVMASNGFFHEIENLHKVPGNSATMSQKFEFFCDDTHYEIEIKKPVSSDVRSSLSFAEMSLNGMPGKGFSLKRKIEKTKECEGDFPAKGYIYPPEDLLTVTFDQALCQNPALTGGKGSSLGKLYSMSNELGKLSDKTDALSFEVPKGVVVTTKAYKMFTRGNLGDSLKQFQKTVWSDPEHSKEHCQMMVKEVSEADLPTDVAESIKSSLNFMFGDRLAGMKFAVRSSATGEDTEQMSAAGQMETFLGLKGFEEILQAVKKCWASQFDLPAVEYKRRYGQLLNTPMAVVIQEMVACDVAGVAFTCDPVNGNPLFINLTANWGLGESVVSATSDPDTIVLERDLHNNIKFHSQQVGKKHAKIIMDENSGTRVVELAQEDSSDCCLSKEMSVQIGKIAVKVEEMYGSPRDIEWGIANQKVFLFQARPITSLDRDTDFEIRHMFDTHRRCEKEYLSKANVGEVMPGASSPLSIDYLNRIFDVSNKRQFMRFDKGTAPEVPYFQRRLVTAYNHVFFCLIDSFLRMSKEDNNQTKSFMISLFGRPIEDPELVKLSLDRHKKFVAAKKTHMFRLIFIFWMMFVSGIRVRRFLKKIKPYKVFVKEQNSPFQILSRIGFEFPICGEAMTKHMGCTISSSFWNMMVLSFLAKEQGEWNSDVYADFAFLLSSCSGVLSADVPAALEKLAIQIQKCMEIEKFKKMSDKEAHEWLQNGNSEASQQFREFLATHGHRCLKEFDVYSTTWGDNPMPLVKMLKDLVGTKTEETVERSSSFSYILSKLHVQLTFMSRMKFRLLLPNCQRGVREREFSKSAVILSIDKLRKPFHMLANAMVRDGYLPHKQMLFFLCIEEINQLIKTRSPRLVARAFKRWKCHEELDKFFFPEIINSIPKPINLTDAVEGIESSEGLTMHGVPVSPGVVKGTARVVVHLSDASNIQPNDILITYSTDIGWSPYFPLLSGVVTELGGLISHGAVVAREYGLPCVVALHGATRVFKSGDLVVLDGNKGILKRIES